MDLRRRRMVWRGRTRDQYHSWYSMVSWNLARVGHLFSYVGRVVVRLIRFHLHTEWVLEKSDKHGYHDDNYSRHCNEAYGSALEAAGSDELLQAVLYNVQASCIFAAKLLFAPFK